MKKKLLCMVLAASMVIAPLTVSAGELVDEEVAADVAVSDVVDVDVADSEMSIAGFSYGENGEVTAEEEMLNDDMLNDTDIALYFGDKSANGYVYFKAWEKKYFYNGSGTTMYVTNVYENGKYQHIDRAWSNGTKQYWYDNSSHDAVMFYKYNATTHKILTTWANAKDWKYYDVFPSIVDWQYPGVKFCVDKKYMNGTGTNTFDPNEILTRGMVVTVLYNVEGKPSISFVNRFSDAPNGKWFSQAISWGATKGVVNGYGNGLFGTNDSVTREQFAVMLYNYAKYKNLSTTARADLKSFPDNGQIASWAREAVSWAVANKIINGTKIDGVLYINPQGKCTRAECATMIKNYFGK